MILILDSLRNTYKRKKHTDVPKMALDPNTGRSWWHDTVQDFHVVVKQPLSDWCHQGRGKTTSRNCRGNCERSFQCTART